MYLKSTKLSDLDPNKKYDFIIPIGSTEQHGPFLPFGTDTYSTDEFLKRIGHETPSLIILPTLEYSCSAEHEGFIGTIWLKETTLVSILDDVCQSIAPYARTIMLISGHGGNLETIQQFVQDKVNAYGPSLHYIDLDGEHLVAPMEALIKGPLDPHAGNIETSMMLAIAPEFTSDPNGYTKTPINEPWETSKLIDKSKDGIADPHPNWVVSEQIGQEVIRLIVEDALRQIKTIIS